MAEQLRTIKAICLAAVVAVCLAAAALLPAVPAYAVADAPAYAAAPEAVAVSEAAETTDASITAAMETAYKRSVAALNAYDHANGTSSKLHATYSTNDAGCSVIKVNVSDLGLTKTQKQQVMDRVYYNTDYWYIDAIGNGKFTTKDLVYTCQYKDSAIPGMKTKMKAATDKALAYIKGCSTNYQKVHMLHDWLINNVNYGAGTLENKLAYGCIVKKSADCMGFAYGMDYLLRAAGFDTAFALNMGVDHIWNMVKLGDKWYHVDVTWANTYTGKYFWTDCTCHRWLLLTDAAMDQDEHTGWTVLKNGVKRTTIKATDDTYDNFGKADWNAKCPKSVGVGGKIIRDGFVFQVTVKNEAVKLASVSSSFRGKTSYTVPSHIWYRGHDYRVSRVGSKAFQGCTAATKVTLGSKVKYISSYAFTGCKKLTTLVLKTPLLTKAGVTGSLKGSSVTTVKLSGSSTLAKKAAYKTYFAKSNSGRIVTVKAA